MIPTIKSPYIISLFFWLIVHAPSAHCSAPAPRQLPSKSGDQDLLAIIAARGESERKLRQNLEQKVDNLEAKLRTLESATNQRQPASNMILYASSQPAASCAIAPPPYQPDQNYKLPLPRTFPQLTNAALDELRQGQSTHTAQITTLEQRNQKICEQDLCIRDLHQRIARNEQIIIALGVVTVITTGIALKAFFSKKK